MSVSGPKAHLDNAAGMRRHALCSADMWQESLNARLESSPVKGFIRIAKASRLFPQPLASR